MCTANIRVLRTQKQVDFRIWNRIVLECEKTENCLKAEWSWWNTYLRWIIDQLFLRDLLFIDSKGLLKSFLQMFLGY